MYDFRSFTSPHVMTRISRFRAANPLMKSLHEKDAFEGFSVQGEHTEETGEVSGCGAPGLLSSIHELRAVSRLQCVVLLESSSVEADS